MELQRTSYEHGDCDGDGVTDADEINGPDGDPATPDGTDSNDACDYDVADISYQ
ncbi:hypothetical protein [Nonlabens tegetincola]|uniref:hypothetical protein n=1 Tax=Nonlabens tegetincola TaxID=323273 RepID=UPI0015E40DF8|nr:hypothetical protein [Nonlabens tegetincola]